MPQKISKLNSKLTKVFNAYIRRRDAGKLCISCGKRPMTQAGHYFPTSSTPQPSMRFNEHNVNGQCSYCNKWLHGNQHGYAEGLIRKYGSYIIDELNLQKSFKQNPWTPFEYEVLIKYYKDKK